MTLRVVFADVNPLSIQPTKGTPLPHLRDAAGGAVGTSSVFREPYGAEWVASAVREWTGAEVEVQIQGLSSSQEYAERLALLRPDVLALGVHATCVAPEAFRVAEALRQAAPQAVILAGGYHPSGDPAGVLEVGVSGVLVGEAEAAFAEVCASLVEGRPWHDIEGVVAREPAPARRRSRFSAIPFSDYPWPVRSAEAIRLSRCAPLAFPPPNEQTGAAQISYSRGCPYRCTYCQSDQVFGPRVRYRKAADVVAEMRHVRDEYGASFFFFTDLTFNLNRARVRELCEELIRSNLGVHWFAYATVDGLEPDELQLMREAGCTRLGIGIESVVAETLERAKAKLHYRRLEQILVALQAVDSAGILVRGYMMAGWPWETPESYGLTAEALAVLPIDHLRIAFAVPFAGTSLANAYPVIQTDLARYTTNEPVFANTSMAPEEQLELVRKLIRDHLNSSSYAAHVAAKVGRFPELARSFRFYFSYLRDRRLLTEHERLRFLDLPGNRRSGGADLRAVAPEAAGGTT